MAALVLLCTACVIRIDGKNIVARTKKIKASNHIVMRPVDNPAPYTKIDASGTANVEYTQSTDRSTTLSITAPDNIIDLLEVYSSNGTLEIRMKPGYYIDGNSNIVIVTSSPSLNGVDLSGACELSVRGGLQLGDGDMEVDISGVTNVDIDALACGRLKVETSGASDANIGQVTCRLLAIEASGTSDVELGSGSANSAQYSTSGASNITTDKVHAANVMAKSSGASNVSCHACKSLNASTSGASGIDYSGNPASVQRSSSGTSSIRQR